MVLYCLQGAILLLCPKKDINDEALYPVSSGQLIWLIAAMTKQGKHY